VKIKDRKKKTKTKLKTNTTAPLLLTNNYETKNNNKTGFIMTARGVCNNSETPFTRVQDQKLHQYSTPDMKSKRAKQKNYK